jgi:hypothetical protein
MSKIASEPIVHQFVKAAEPPKGPEMALFLTRTIQTFVVLPTMPVHFIPEGS